MKKVIGLSIILCLTVINCFASNPFDEFKNQITGVAADIAQKNLDNLAKDLGPVLGGGSFRSAKNLGLPGFDIGIRVPVRNVINEDAIVKAAGIDSIPLPMLQAEIGLPLKIDLIARYTSYQDSNLIGYGLRYMIYDSWIPGIPYLAIQSVYNTLNVDTGVNKFKANTLSTALIASWKFVVVEPYLGVSLDNTSVEPDSSLNIGKNGSANSVRIDGGISVSLFPLTYLQLGVTSADSNIGYTAGLGIKF
ncbi:MAG: hypothetical protein NT145_02270 [Elusimicrobia bacterium]|nr:hypothetical protein [Elusimicrobiota bacterium]